jgi:hypothetical protein
MHATAASTPAAAAAAEAKSSGSASVWREQDPLLFLRDLKKLGQVIIRDLRHKLQLLRVF